MTYFLGVYNKALLIGQHSTAVRSQGPPSTLALPPIVVSFRYYQVASPVHCTPRV